MGRFFTTLATREAQEYWSGNPIPSPGDIPNAGIKLGLLHFRWILYQLSYQGSPIIIFPIQGSHPGLPHCRQILYQLSYQETPRMLEWIAYPFSSDFPNPGIKPRSPALQVDSLPVELPGKPKIVEEGVPGWAQITSVSVNSQTR